MRIASCLPEAASQTYYCLSVRCPAFSFLVVFVLFELSFLASTWTCQQSSTSNRKLRISSNHAGSKPLLCLLPCLLLLSGVRAV